MTKRRQRVLVNDLMQQDYVYLLTEPAGRNFHTEFRPELSPKQMLQLGVFGGRYMTDCVSEFPADWFSEARLCHQRHDPELNFFGVNASQPLSVWRQQGWIYDGIRAAGFSGIAGISWEDAALMMSAKSNAGKRCGVTRPKLRNIAGRVT